MSHGWTYYRSTGIRGPYHIVISEHENFSKVYEEYATEFDVTLNGKKVFFRELRMSIIYFKYLCMWAVSRYV